MGQERGGLPCPKCQYGNTRILETRHNGNIIKRTRLCLFEMCNFRFKTVEQIVMEDNYGQGKKLKTLTRKQIATVKYLLSKNFSPTWIGKRMKLNRHTISSIKAGKARSYREIPAHNYTKEFGIDF